MTESERLERSLLFALDPEIKRFLPNAPLDALRKHVTSALRLKGVAHAEGLVGLCRIAHRAPTQAAEALRAHGYAAAAAQIAQPEGMHVFTGTDPYR